MNELAKNNKLNRRYTHDELIIKRGLFMLPNSYLVFNDSSKILFRDNQNKVDEDINLKILNLIRGSFQNLGNLQIDQYDRSGKKDTKTVNSLQEIIDSINTSMRNFNSRISSLEAS